MKKNLIVTAIAALAASFAGAANAESSVTLYGLVDAGFTYVNNVQAPEVADHFKNNSFSMTGNNVQMSRWGLRGAEDLGGGMKAIFTLENGFDVTNGTSIGGSGFGRQAFVGLSTNAGTVTLGRQTDSVTDYLGPLSATGTWGGTYFAHPGNQDNLNGDDLRENNSIKFQSANYAGFSFSGLYGFSNVGNFAANRAYSIGAGYANAGLKLGLAYMQGNGVGGNARGAITDFVFLNNDDNQVATDVRQRTFGAGASYSIGAATFGALWTQTRLDRNSSDGSVITNNYEVNGRYALTPALSLGAAYTYSRYRDSFLSDAAVHAHQFGLQTDYALSKRTDIYAEGIVQIASGGDEGVYPAAGINGVPTSTSSRQVVLSTGIRHRF